MAMTRFGARGRAGGLVMLLAVLAPALSWPRRSLQLPSVPVSAARTGVSGPLR